ncbi:MAG: hypothetical protein HFF62_15910 [Oscillospiraceae bacterium]|nr:hypothetical protein [Oscillospiraceae bacterium]
MTQWKIFGGQAWAALKSSLKSLKEAVDGNTSAVSGLGMELAEMAETTAAALNGKQDKLTPGPGIAINGSVISVSGSGKAFSVGDTAPENTNLLWIDTGAGVTKYYTGSAWEALPVAWG